MPEITIPVLPLLDDKRVAVDVERDPFTDVYTVKVSGGVLDEQSAVAGVWQLCHAIATAMIVVRSAHAAG